MDTIILILSILASGGLWLKFIYEHDKIEPEPIKVVLKILIVGGVISALIAGTINEFMGNIIGVSVDSENMDFNTSFIYSMLIGFNEEFTKGLVALYLIKNLDEFDEPIDGIIYATAVALGFAIYENFYYVSKFGLANLVVRSFTAIPLHVGLAAYWGYSISEVKFLGGTSYFDHMKKTLIISSILHGLYDFFQFYISGNPLSLVIAFGFAFFLIRVMTSKMNYLLSQSPFLKAGVCTRCGTVNTKESIKCKKCGANLMQSFYKICNDCLSKVPLTAKNCPECNAEIK